VAERIDSIQQAEDGLLTYRSAGVDIEAGEEAVRLIKKDVESTYIPVVLGSLGGFAGLFQLPKDLDDPVLVTGTDGVGTKILLAQETGRLDTVGIDLVAMSVNDVLTIGARPILFLDYIAVGRLTPADMAQMVAGVAEGCRQAGCALVGGEMAEMPGLYDPGEFDMAGFCVGLGERKKLIDRSAVTEGDVVLGLASSGLHSNGFSLVRKVLGSSGLGLGDAFPGTDMPAADVLLTPTRIYVRSVLGLLERGLGAVQRRLSLNQFFGRRPGFDAVVVGPGAFDGGFSRCDFGLGCPAEQLILLSNGLVECGPGCCHLPLCGLNLLGARSFSQRIQLGLCRSQGCLSAPYL